MPRPKPPEQLLPVAYRLTRTQIRKVQEMGGVAWLRELISSYQPRRVRSTLLAYRQLSERDRAIAESTEPSAVLAKRYNLSRERIDQIRKPNLDEARRLRNEEILRSDEPASVLALRYELTPHAVRAIRRKASCK